MHIVADRQENPSQDALRTVTGPGTSTDRRAPPSHQASSPLPGIPPRQGPSSLTSEVPQPGERERGRSLWLLFFSASQAGLGAARLRRGSTVPPVEVPGTSRTGGPRHPRCPWPALFFRTIRNFQWSLRRERDHLAAALPFLLFEVLEDPYQVIVETSSMLLANLSDFFDDRVLPHEISLP
jgi:hypothetical protein